MPDEEWLNPTEQQSQIILACGWALLGFGGLVFLYASAALAHHLWVLRQDRQRSVQADAFGTLSPPKQRQAVVSLVVKALLTPSLLFRVLSIASILYVAVPIGARCEELPSSCGLQFFVLQALLAVPSFTLNSLFILLSLFWPWLLSLTSRSERPFSHLLLDWALVSACMWAVVLLLFVAAAVSSAPLLYAVIAYFSNAVVLINIVVFTFFGVKLVMRMRQFGDQGIKFTRKLFAITFLVMLFAAIRVVFTIFLNTSLYHPTDTFAWVLSYLLWCLCCEFLPELALLFLVANPISIIRKFCHPRIISKTDYFSDFPEN